MKADRQVARANQSRPVRFNWISELQVVDLFIGLVIYFNKFPVAHGHIKDNSNSVGEETVWPSGLTSNVGVFKTHRGKQLVLF